jgi:phospho-N-acetylmuramoyl-pentapeptide-transferase
LDQFFENPIWFAFWFPFLVALAVSFPLLKWLRANAKQIIDPHAPEGHQLKKGTPTMGGIMIVAGVLGSCLWWNSTEASGRGGSTSIMGCFACFFVFAVIGFVDDFVVPKFTGKRGLGWLPKLVMQVAGAAIPAWVVYMNDANVIAKVAVFAFFILFLSNAVNFADGLDGLSSTLWLALVVGLIGVGIASNVHIAIAAGVIVFLFYNAPPAKVFMGDVASLPIGATLGWGVAEYLTGFRHGFLGIDWLRFVPMVALCGMMIAMLVPVPLQVGYYKLTKKRIFPATPIHHSFEKIGWPETRIVFVFFLVQMVLSMLATTLASVMPVMYQK